MNGGTVMKVTELTFIVISCYFFHFKTAACIHYVCEPDSERYSPSSPFYITCVYAHLGTLFYAHIRLYVLNVC